MPRSIANDERGQNAWCARSIERGLGAYEAQLQVRGDKDSAGDTLTIAESY